jgi:shikimate kinase
VALVGLSGTGKSTVAPLLARRFGLAAVDLDRAVEAATGRTVAEVFAERGEPAFRDLESAELRRALDGPPAVLATGGGVVVRDANRSLLRARCRVVWLRGDPAELAGRLAGTDEERPVLAVDPVATLHRLAAEREAAYREVADLVVDIDGLGPDEVADRIAGGLSADEDPQAGDHRP